MSLFPFFIEQGNLMTTWINAEIQTGIRCGMKTLKNRIRLSQYFGVGLFLFYFFGSSVWTSKNAVEETLFLIGTILIAVGVTGRAWCLGYIAGKKKKVLLKYGPYSLCRHPLYFFGLLGALGVGLSTQTLTIPLIIFVAFVTYYPSVMKKEEKELYAIFPSEFEDYAKKIPRFIPSLSKFSELEKIEISSIAFRRGISDLIYFIIFPALFEFIEMIREAGWIPTYYVLY